jgi:type I restriction enzyme S subunit
MKKYPKYKVSGVEWIGEIPEGWMLSKFKYDTTTPVQYGLNISSDRYKEDGVRFIRITDLTEEGTLIMENGKYLEKSEVPDDFLLKKYDVLLCRSGHTVGKSYLHLEEGEYTSGGYLVRFNFSSLPSSKFIFYLTKTNFYWDWIKLNTVVSTIENVNGDKYQNFFYPKPPLHEQQQIVTYLDQKTILIDQIISGSEKKIELLKEQRTATINHAVTKGLNPKVKMKNSGIDWIGDIPEGWGVKKLKGVCQIFGRIGFRGYTTEDIVEEGEGAITISPSNIKNDVFSIQGENTFISWDKYYESPEIMIYEDDIIIVKTGSTIGKTAIIPEVGREMTINPQLIVLKNILIDNKYLFHQTTCAFIKNSFFVEQTGSTTPTISQEKINNFPILEPPLQEQKHISNYLDQKTKEIDDLIASEKMRVELLKEYRQSLISEVVTGKIKVTI